MRAESALGVTPDETALAGREHLDARYVESYDRKARAEPGEDLVLLRRHGLDAESTLVDLGAGTGTFALAAAAECARVVAADVSPAMVAAIQTKAAEGGIANVEAVEAGFLGYEHTGRAPDVVYTRNALHHLPDFWKAVALQRMTQLLRPGGILYLRDLVFCFPLREAQTFVGAWLDTASESPEEGWTRNELETHLRDEYSTFNWLLEPIIEQAGFRIEWASHGEERVYAHYLCRKPER